MTSAPLPVMPPEIWTIVLESCMEDLIHLWTQCRQVSTQFKVDIENIFIKQHAPIMSMSFELYTARRNQALSTHYVCLFRNTKYHGFSKDRKTALFSALAVDQEKNLRPWTNTPMAMGPYYYVQFREHSHRVNVPCCFELTEEGEVVFEMDWKKMLEELLQKGAEAFSTMNFPKLREREGFTKFAHAQGAKSNASRS